MAYTYQVGDRVRLTEDVDRYPYGIGRAGELGTVSTIGAVERVTLEVHHDEFNEWDNRLEWFDANDDYGRMADQVEHVTGPEVDHG